MRNCIFIEAEAFADRGGWVVDSQFIDQMGSAYLLANGMGSPVANARQQFRAVPGEYLCWVRTKDWLPEYHPGCFTLSVNGHASPQIFGESGMAGWRWEKAGMFLLEADNVMELIDLTGYYGRCDAILFTDDFSWQPPEGAAELSELRRSFAKPIIDEGCFDFVVVGGGLAGCTAAVAAARNGSRVALVQDRPLVGGNASTELLIPPCGHWNADEPGTDPTQRVSGYNPRETGIVEEYRTTGFQRTREGALYGNRLMRMVQGEPNVHLFLNMHIMDVECAPDGSIAAVTAHALPGGGRHRFRAPLFSDCTGDSVFAISAGAAYRHGKETRAMHNEPWAPEEASTDTMGNGIKYFVAETLEEQPFQAPEWAYRFPACSDFTPGRHPDHRGVIGEHHTSDDYEGLNTQWKLELGGTGHTLHEAEEIRDELFRLVYGLWDHTKNHCPQCRDAARTRMLRWVGFMAAKRENTRLIGDYILTQNDICEGTQFEDVVAYGAWVVDDHYSDGFFHDGSNGKHYDDFAYAAYGKEFGIPLRCLYSQNVPNLLMAGRNISATHLAMSDTRVMLTCALMGHAAGDAAALCTKYGCRPRQVYELHVDELQAMLHREWAYLPGKPPQPLQGNLAASAVLSASSCGMDTRPDWAVNNRSRAGGCCLNAWMPDPEAEGPHWLRLAWSTPVEANLLEIAFPTRDKAPARCAVTVRYADGTQARTELAGKKTRRACYAFASGAVAEIVICSPEPTGICEVRVWNADDACREVCERAYANMKRKDSPVQMPWELSW